MKPKKKNKYEINVYKDKKTGKYVVKLEEADLLFKKAGIDYSFKSEDGGEGDNGDLFIYLDYLLIQAGFNGLVPGKEHTKSSLDSWFEKKENSLSVD